MNCLILGAAGFLGSHIADLRARAAEHVTALERIYQDVLARRGNSAVGAAQYERGR